MFERTKIAVSAALLLGAACAGNAAEPPVTDPTRVPYAQTGAETAAADGAWQLHATHVSENSRSAVIDDRIVTIGSVIDGAEVVAIETGRVDLRRGTRITSLELRLPAVKQPSARGARP